MPGFQHSKGVLVGRRTVLRDDDALTGRQPVVLDHVRRAAPIKGVVDALDRGDTDRRRGRHAGGGHHVLGEGLRPLDAGGRRARTEDGEPAGPQLVGGPVDQRDLRSDDHQIGVDDVREVGDRHRVGRVDRMAGGQLPGPGVAGTDMQVADARVAAERPQQGVLTGTRADHENAHVGQSIRRRWPTEYPRSK